jgi:hypothetical protein
MTKPVSQAKTEQEAEIDPVFRKRVNDVFDQWQENKLPFSDVLKQIEFLRQETLHEGAEVNEAGIYNILGIMYGYRSQYDNSIENFSKARELFTKHNVKRRIASCDLNLGETYRLCGNFTRARQYFHNAYEEAKTLNDIALQITALTNEGQMWFSLNSIDKAGHTLENALELTQNWHPESEREIINRADGACELHHALTAVFLAENRAEMAWFHAVQAYEKAEFTGRPVRIGYAHRALGDVMSELGESPDPNFSSDPEAHYQAAMDAFRQVKADGEIGKTLYAYGQSLAKRNKRRSAGTKFQQAMVIFTKLGMTDDASKAAEAQMMLI